MRQAYLKPKLIRASMLQRDSNGNFYNTPTLGAELFVNGGFDADTNWTKGAGWTIAGGVAVGTATSASLTQAVATANRFGRVVYDLASRTIGSVNSNTPAGMSQTAPATYVAEGQNTAAAVGVTGATFTGTVDNLSLKQYNYPECFVLSDGFTPYRNALMYVPFASGISQLCLIALCDNLDSPLSYLRIIYTLTAAGVTAVGLTKFVNDTRTSLIAATAVTFVANAPVELRRLPGTNTFQLFYNSIQVGADQTIADATIIGNTRYGFVGLSNLAVLTDLQLDGMSIF